MIPTKELFSVVRKNNIKLKFDDLPIEVGGCYEGGGPVKIILLNKILKHNRKAFRSVLAKQLGLACTSPHIPEHAKKNPYFVEICGIL